MRGIRTAVVAAVALGLAFPAFAASDDNGGAESTLSALESVPGVVQASNNVTAATDSNSAIVTQQDATSVDVPKDPSAGVTLDPGVGPPIQIDLPGSTRATDARPLADGVVAYQDAAPSMTVVAQALPAEPGSDVTEPAVATPAAAATAPMLDPAVAPADTQTPTAPADPATTTTGAPPPAAPTDQTTTPAPADPAQQPAAADATTSSGPTAEPPAPLALGAGVRLFTVISSGDAPSDYSFPLTVPNGGTLEQVDGSFLIKDGDGVTTAMVSAPWAKDASGNPVPVSYTLDGTTLHLHVDHQGAAYPVVVDPRVSDAGASARAAAAAAAAAKAAQERARKAAEAAARATAEARARAEAEAARIRAEAQRRAEEAQRAAEALALAARERAAQEGDNAAAYDPGTVALERITDSLVGDGTNLGWSAADEALGGTGALSATVDPATDLGAANPLADPTLNDTVSLFAAGSPPQPPSVVPASPPCGKGKYPDRIDAAAKKVVVFPLLYPNDDAKILIFEPVTTTIGLRARVVVCGHTAYVPAYPLRYDTRLLRDDETLHGRFAFETSDGNWHEYKRQWNIDSGQAWPGDHPSDFWSQVDLPANQYVRAVRATYFLDKDMRGDGFGFVPSWKIFHIECELAPSYGSSTCTSHHDTKPHDAFTDVNGTLERQPSSISWPFPSLSGRFVTMRFEGLGWNGWGRGTTKALTATVQVFGGSHAGYYWHVNVAMSRPRYCKFRREIVYTRVSYHFTTQVPGFPRNDAWLSPCS